MSLNSKLIDQLLNHPYEVTKDLLCTGKWVAFSEDQKPDTFWIFDTNGKARLLADGKETVFDWDLLGKELIISILGVTLLRFTVYAYQYLYLGLFTENDESVLILVSIQGLAEFKAMASN